MGSIDGSVMCTCHEYGLIKIPEKFILILSTAGYPVFNRDKCQRKELEIEFDHWVQSCCPHSEFDLINVEVGRFREIAQFLQFIDEHSDNGQYDTIKHQIPDFEGSTTVEHAIKMLKELLTLERIIKDDPSHNVIKDTVSALKKLCIASIQTNHPIYWF